MPVDLVLIYPLSLSDHVCGSFILLLFVCLLLFAFVFS